MLYFHEVDLAQSVSTCICCDLDKNVVDLIRWTPTALVPKTENPLTESLKIRRSIILFS